METVLLTLLIAFTIYAFATSDGAIPYQYAPKPPQLGIDPAVQITKVAKRLGLRASSFDTNVWFFMYESKTLESRVSIHLEQGLSDDVRTWLVPRVVLHNDASLPGGLAIGKRNLRSNEEPVDLPLLEGFQDVYWLDGEIAEILATCDTALCEALLDAQRSESSWSHIMIGQGTVFERIAGTETTLGDLEDNLISLLEHAHTCVRTFPKTRDLAAQLRRHVESDDEPLTMRWRAAHVLLTQMPRTRSAKKLGGSLDDLPEALYHVCSVWHLDHDLDPRDVESSIVGLLTGDLVDDGAPLFVALSEAGWEPSVQARAELMRRGSAALGALLREGRALEGGRLTLSEEPDRGALSQTAQAGELSPTGEEV